MRPVATRLSLVTLLLVASVTAWGRSPHFDPQKMMSTEEVERGMKAVGKSVFSGVKIEEFDLEILGVLSKADLGSDLILARVTSGPVVERQSGIIGGMSGSPVYVKGRLLGAIAYAWSFAREPIAGITAIDSMLEAYDAGPKGQARLPKEHPARGARVAGRWVEEARIVAASRAHGPFSAAHTINMYPVGPLVYASGIRGPGMERLRELFEPYGIEPLAGPGRKRPPVPTELEPGAAVGVSFAQGNFDITGIGTVTYRDGDTILAFGHPMMELGSVEMPLTTAWVHDIVPSIARSNKLASAMETVGTLTRDCTWSVGGKVGAEPRVIPAHFTITDEDRDLTKEFDFEVTRQQLLTPGLLMSVLQGSMAAAYNSGGKGIGTVDFTLRGEKGAEISRRDVSWHPGNPVYVTQWIDEAMTVMTENRFEPQQVASLKARVSLTGKDRSAVIERIYTEENVARAGKELTIHVVIRPENAEPVEKVVTLKLPEDLPKGEMRVGAAAGADEWDLRYRLRLLLPQFYSLGDIAEIIESLGRSDQLYVAAGVPEVVLSVQGTALPQLPAEAAGVLTASARTDMTAGYSELSKIFDTEWVLYGWDYIRIPTEDRKGERGKVSHDKKDEEEPKAEAASAGNDGKTTALQSSLLPGNDSGSPGSEEGRYRRWSFPASRLSPPASKLWWLASAFAEDAQLRQAAAGGAVFDRDLRRADAAQIPREVAHEPENAEAQPPEQEQQKETEEPEKKEEETVAHPEPGSTALSRQLSTWTQDTADDFAKGKAEGVLVRSDGTLLLAPGSKVLAEADEPYIWSVAPVGDAVYYGTASPGRLYRWTEAEGAKLVHDTGEFAVLSLLASEDGSLLAGTGPNGLIFRVTPEGKVEEAYKLPASYVWSLARAPDGRLAAGTGPHGEIYRLEQSGKFSVMATISQPHVLALTVAAGSLYAAGGDQEGGVYRISDDGSAVDIFGTDEQSCTGVAADEQGRLFVSTASDGKVFLIDQDGNASELYTSDDGDVLDILFTDGRAYAASTDDARIVAADADKRSGVAYKDELAGQVVCLASAGDGMIYAGTSNPGRLIRLDLRGEISGHYDSAVLDAERLSRWARIFWDAEVPQGAGLEMLTRSGNSEVAEDGSWGSWSAAYPESGAQIASAPTRFLQYRVKMTGRDSKTPLVQRIAVIYLPSNQPPTLEIDDPEPGQAIRGEHEITWKAEDDDDDTLLITIYVKPHGSDEWQEIAKVTGDDYYSWDTTKMEDGAYSLKLLCTDAPSNPIGAESVEKIIDTITVDQGYPKLVLVGRPEVSEEKRATINGVALDTLSRITSIDWSLGAEDEWRAAAPDDGMLDSRQEVFTIETGALAEQETAIKVRLRDAAGNVTVESLSLTDGIEEETHLPPAPPTEPEKE